MVYDYHPSRSTDSRGEDLIDASEDYDPISRFQKLQSSINTRAHETKEKIATLKSKKKTSPLSRPKDSKDSDVSSSSSTLLQLESRDDFTFGGRKRTTRMPASVVVKEDIYQPSDIRETPPPPIQRIDFKTICSSNDTATLTTNSGNTRMNGPQITNLQSSRARSVDDQKTAFETMMAQLDEKQLRIETEIKKLEETQKDMAHFLTVEAASLPPIQEVRSKNTEGGTISEQDLTGIILSNLSTTVDKYAEHEGDDSQFQIVAPANLPYGFVFETYINGEKFKFKVPKGGVTTGQIWKNPIVIPEHLIHVPVGKWKDRLWNISANGIFHPLVILSFIAPLLALAQILTRAQINTNGSPAKTKLEIYLTYQKLAAITFFCIGMNAIALGSIYVNWVRGVYMLFDFMLLILVQALYYIQMVVITTSTRNAIRQMYRIPQCCGRGSDFLVSIMFTPLVIAQLGRHTCDYDVYQSRFFSRNGLSLDDVELSDPVRDDYMEPTYEPPHQDGVEKV